MLVNMDKNLSRIDFPQLGVIREKLTQIDRLMGEAQGIDFRVDQLDDRFAKLFPQDFSAALRTDQRVLNSRTRLDMSMHDFRHTMTVPAPVVEHIHNALRKPQNIV